MSNTIACGSSFSMASTARRGLIRVAGLREIDPRLRDLVLQRQRDGTATCRRAVPAVPRARGKQKAIFEQWKRRDAAVDRGISHANT